MNLVLLGPPGAGKGTQARFVVRDFAVPHLSTGDMIRASILRGGPVGAAARSLVEAGELIPDDVVRRMVEERLRDEDCRQGFILDGYPRNLRQARDLEEILSSMDLELYRVIALTLDEESLVRRLSGRRTCTGCGTVFNMGFNPPRTEGICDACGSRLVQREDDREEVIRQRLRVYHDVTRPLAEYYDQQGILREVPGDGPVEDVARKVRAILENGT